MNERFAPRDISDASTDATAPLSGFALVDAVVALLVAATTAAALYSLMSASLNASRESSRLAFASVATQSLCTEMVAHKHLAAGRVRRTYGEFIITADISREDRPALRNLELWRAVCYPEPAVGAIVIHAYTLLQRDVS